MPQATTAGSHGRIDHNPPDAAATLGEPWPRPAYAWFVTGILTFVYVLSFVDRLIISLLIDPIRADLGLSDTQFSLLQGLSFALFFAIVALPIAAFADRTSRRTIIGIGVFFWSLMTALCGAARTFPQMFLARMGVGLGEAALGPAAFSLLSDYFPPHRLARATAVFGCGTSLGVGIAMIAGGVLASWASGQPTLVLPAFGEIRSWQLVFIIVGLFGMAFSLLLWVVREPARRVARLGTGGALDTSEAPGWGAVLQHIRAEWHIYSLLTIAYTLINFFAYANTAWIPAFFMRTYGWSVGQVGWNYGVVVMVASTAGMLYGGMLVGQLLARGKADANVRAPVIGLIGLIPTAIAYPLMDSAYGALAVLVLFNVFFSIPFGGGYAALQDITPNRLRARVSALFILVLNLFGLGLGPTAVALLTDYVVPGHELRWSLAILNAIVVPSALICMLAARKAYSAACSRYR